MCCIALQLRLTLFRIGPAALLVASWFLACFLLLSSARVVHSQVDVRFEWPVGETQVYQIEQETNQRLEIYGTTSVSEIRKSERRSREYLASKKQGEHLIRQSLDSLKLQLLVGDTLQFTFDSARPDGDDPSAEMTALRRMLGVWADVTWETTFDKDLNVVQVSGLNQVLDGLSRRHRESIAPLFAPDYLRECEQAWLHAIPEGELEPGSSWTRRTETRLESGQQMTLVYEYSVAENPFETDVDSLRIELQVIEAQWQIANEAWPEVTIEAGDLEVVKSQGYLLFDLEQGCIVHSEETVTLLGELEFRLGEVSDSAEYTVELDRQLDLIQ